MNTKTNLAKTDFRPYENGTGIYVRGPWQLNVAAVVMCPDGKLRRTAYLSDTPDTYFSIPAGMRFKRRYYRGWLSNDNGTLKFNPYSTQSDLCDPLFAWKYSHDIPAS